MPRLERYALTPTETAAFREWMQRPSGSHRVTTGLSAEAVDGGGLDLLMRDETERGPAPAAHPRTLEDVKDQTQAANAGQAIGRPQAPDLDAIEARLDYQRRVALAEARASTEDVLIELGEGSRSIASALDAIEQTWTRLPL